MVSSDIHIYSMEDFILVITMMMILIMMILVVKVFDLFSYF